MTRGMKFALSLVSAFVLAGASITALAESHVRIVRLSYIDGQVKMDRATGLGLEKAILNTPVVQGTSFVTGSDGLAEIEFEDQSTVRLTENSEVRFRQLSMNDAGMKTNDIDVVKGVVYFDVHSKADDIYRAGVEGSSLHIRRDTQVRLSADPDRVKVAVFKGYVQLENQPQMVSVKKKETLSLDPNNPSAYKITSGTEPLPVDAWNKERDAYTSAYARNAGYGGPKSGYGLQDLNYYGGFFFAPGYGNVWQPFGFAGSMAGFSPYNNGAWMFYPGAGYMWASAYPWGWLPFHYGSWAFLGGGVGWAWVPGNYGGPWYYNNFQAAPKVVKAPAGWNPANSPALSAASAAQPTVVVGRVGPTAYIPGGRVTPNFGSVIPGRTITASTPPHGGIGASAPRTAIKEDHVFAAVPNQHTTKNGHVFIPPAPMAPPSVSTGMPMGGPSYGASAGTTRGSMPAASAGHGSASGHASGGSHQ
jgi:hypothetical protein